MNKELLPTLAKLKSDAPGDPRNESLLKEVRDAPGDSGEFYTPRPVIRFMVEQSFPQLGESILDPACGTGGFPVEAYWIGCGSLE